MHSTSSTNNTFLLNSLINTFRNILRQENFLYFATLPATPTYSRIVSNRGIPINTSLVPPFIVAKPRWNYSHSVFRLSESLRLKYNERNSITASKTIITPPSIYHLVPATSPFEYFHFLQRTKREVRKRPSCNQDDRVRKLSLARYHRRDRVRVPDHSERRRVDERQIAFPARGSRSPREKRPAVNATYGLSARVLISGVSKTQNPCGALADENRRV